MLKRIPFSLLQTGMYVVDAGLPWLENPYLYQQAGVIDSEQQIQSLASQGFTETIVDTSRGTPGACVTIEDTAAAAQCQPVPEEIVAASCPVCETPLRNELPEATKAYTNAITFAQAICKTVGSQGTIDATSAKSIVSTLYESIRRNSNALILLSKFYHSRESADATAVHLVNVTVYAIAFAHFTGHDGRYIQRIGTAALLHDVGKHLLPPSLLDKPDVFSRFEFAAMTRHTVLACEFIENCRMPLDTAQMAAIRHHHERYDGSGYPEKLSGDAIPEMARMLSIADAYDGMTSPRPQRPAIPLHKAQSMLYGMDGKEFHPGYVRRFVSCIGVFPVGSQVRLNTGQEAFVASVNHAEPLRPLLAIISDPRGKPALPELFDLAGQTVYRIEGPATASTIRLDPLQVLESVKIR